MPNLVTDFKALKIAMAIKETLQTIQQANGYNTNPRVTTDGRTITANGDKYTVEVELGDDSRLDARNVEVEVIVTCYVKIDADEDPLTERCKLNQDVRTALLTDGDYWRTKAGTGAAVDWRCDVDGGLFLDAGWSVSEHRFTVRYPQGTNW